MSFLQILVIPTMYAGESTQPGLKVFALLKGQHFLPFFFQQIFTNFSSISGIFPSGTSAALPPRLMISTSRLVNPFCESPSHTFHHQSFTFRTFRVKVWYLTRNFKIKISFSNNVRFKLATIGLSMRKFSEEWMDLSFPIRFYSFNINLFYSKIFHF